MWILGLLASVMPIPSSYSCQSQFQKNPNKLYVATGYSTTKAQTDAHALCVKANPNTQTSCNDLGCKKTN